LWLTDPGDDHPVDTLRHPRRRLTPPPPCRAFGTPDKQRGGVYSTALKVVSFLTNRTASTWVTQAGASGQDDPHVLSARTDTLYLPSKEGEGTTGPLVTAFTVAVFAVAEHSPGAHPAAGFRYRWSRHSTRRPSSTAGQPPRPLLPLRLPRPAPRCCPHAARVSPVLAVAAGMKAPVLDPWWSSGARSRSRSLSTVGSPTGRVRVAGQNYDGTFEAAGNESEAAIDAAYEAKYPGSSAVPIMQGQGPKSAAVRMSPS
jgi:hypothetical protein